MTIRYSCAECGAVLNIKDELAGTQGHCPRCQVEFTVPALEEDAAVGKKPAPLAGEPAIKERARPADGAFSEDDIGDILASGGPVTSTANYRDSGNDFGESDEQRDEADEEDEAARRRRKKAKSQGKKAATGADSPESASIAKNLMGRGEHAAVQDEKKAGRPFGGADGRGEERPDYTAKDVAKHLASIGWPAAVGIIVFLGFCYFIYTRLTPGVNLPPLANISGTVTLDGNPLPKAIVGFQPLTEGPHTNLQLGPSYGTTDEKGKYTLLYMVHDGTPYYGAIIGKHRVLIQATGKDGGELLPPHYSQTSASILKEEVVKGGRTIDFSLSSSPDPPLH